MANYKATITGHGFAESKNTHTPSIKFSLKATFDLDAQQTCEKTFYADLWLSDKAIENTCKTLRDIGFQGDNMGDLNDTQCLVDTEVEITTENDEYNGETRERVKFMNAAGSFAKRGVKPMDENHAKAIAAKYSMYLRNAKKKTPSQTKPNVVEGDDDLPWL